DAKRGAGLGTITVASRLDGERVEVEVRDNGTGIPAAIQHRVFDPFFTTKEVGRGTGQGLSLAHASVVQRHGGKIWFDTHEGQGTTFTVSLPVDADKGAARKAEAA